jgi:hypothetical protein
MLKFQRVQRWIWDTVQREGADLHRGRGLYSALAQAGLCVERVTAKALVGDQLS